jgi:hypothetical protein
MVQWVPRVSGATKVVAVQASEEAEIWPLYPQRASSLLKLT